MDETLIETLMQRIEALIDRKIEEKIAGNVLVELGTSLSEFERLYMFPNNGDEPIKQSLFRKALRWIEATKASKPTS